MFTVCILKRGQGKAENLRSKSVTDVAHKTFLCHDFTQNIATCPKICSRSFPNDPEIFEHDLHLPHFFRPQMDRFAAHSLNVPERMVPQVAESDVEEFIQQELDSFAPMTPRQKNSKKLSHVWIYETYWDIISDTYTYTVNKIKWTFCFIHHNTRNIHKNNLRF